MFLFNLVEGLPFEILIHRVHNPPRKTPPEALYMLNKEVCFFGPKIQLFLNRTLFGVKAMMALKKVFENLFC